jgi:hypothetical protein
MKKFLPIFLAIIIVFTVGALCFYGGMKYSQNKTSTGTGINKNLGGPQNETPSGINGVQQNSGMISGKIIAVNENNITIESQDGSTKIITYSKSTEVNKTEIASTDDFEIGETVNINGVLNEDGGIIAETIQLNPIEKGKPGINQPAQ